MNVEARVVERFGCDLNPLNPGSEEDRLTLGSFILPDQTHRVELLRGALDTARKVPAIVDKANAAEWLSGQLEQPRGGYGSVPFDFYAISQSSRAG